MPPPPLHPLTGRARTVVETLGLSPHPEGGFYRETFRAALGVASPQGPRSASTAIYFLLPAGAFSALHRVRSDEVWHFYDGDPLELHTIDPAGVHRLVRLGSDVTKGEEPQYVVPAGVWQAAVPGEARSAGYSLCGCTVAPGFDFADFDMPGRDQLEREMPALRELVDRLTRG